MEHVGRNANETTCAEVTYCHFYIVTVSVEFSNRTSATVGKYVRTHSINPQVNGYGLLSPSKSIYSNVLSVCGACMYIMMF